MLYTHTFPYKHLTQKPSCCGPTCVQMILFRHDIWIDQEELAYRMGLVLEEKNSSFYSLPFKTVSDGDPMHGFKFYRFQEDSIIKLLADFGFHVTLLYISDIIDFTSTIIATLSENNDMIINFKREGLQGSNRRGGHFVLLSSFDSDTGMITVCDPTPKSPNYWQVSIDEIVVAMSSTWDGRERGIVLMKKM